MPPGRQTLSAKQRLILAVDTPTVEQARRMIDELSDFVGVFKVGLELYMNEGPAVISLFRERGLNLFLDGKFLDIPNTVAKATEAIARRGVQMFTVHATGGSAMLAACAKAANEASSKAGLAEPISLGVTVLTSLSSDAIARELNVRVSMSEQVLHLAGLCRDSGIKGIVASPEEVASLRTRFGTELVLVTPGVRPSWAETNDQTRVATPAQALRDGADYLVIGRPITAAKDRREAAKRLLDEMDSALTSAR